MSNRLNKFMIVIVNRKINRDPYETACQALDIVPVSYIAKNLDNSEIVMKYHGLGAPGARAFGKVLEKNNTLVKIDLTGNQIGQGGTYFALSLAQNRHLTYVNLSDNAISNSLSFDPFDRICWY
jgi:hypothetical protein